MVNPFLNNDNRDIETAIMLENAYVHNIGTAIAYTDGDKIFINTEDNLYKLLPAYNDNMLKWLLWHERFHNELRHHDRFFKYVSRLSKTQTEAELNLKKSEVNIIMDILVHDSLSKMFPELVETAILNLAQLRNCNSLQYTFTTFTLEEMLDEYKENREEGETSGSSSQEENSTSQSTEEGETQPTETNESQETNDTQETSDTQEDKPVDNRSHNHDLPGEPQHDKVDWSKLEDIDTREFITESESTAYVRKIKELKNKKIKLGQLTHTINSLATTTRKRTYATPSTIQIQKDVIMKGRTQGKTALYLCFDASGSMMDEMQLFKDIITRSIPHALNTPTLWFSGYGETVPYDPEGRSEDYYKGTFKDFLSVKASNGYNDDGDRTIELCWRAEQLGYSPIGITDGGGNLSWSIDKLKQLKRTVLVGQNTNWLSKAKSLNDKIQIISIE